MSKFEGVSDDQIDELTQLRLRLTSIETEYNRVRHQFVCTTQQYYRQSIASNIVKEVDIQDLFDKCCALKEEYVSIKKELLSKRPTPKKWSFQN